MIKYVGVAVTFQEVPNQISLVLSIANCQGKCKGCHSPWLREDIGDNLLDDLPKLLDKYGSAITCVCFMGEGNDPFSLYACADIVNARGVPCALYSGRDNIQDIPDYEKALQKFKFIKIGSYQEAFGGLDSPTTNQRMYEIVNGQIHSITSFFQKRSNYIPL